MDHTQSRPLKSLEDWEDFVVSRYPEENVKAAKEREDYRNYDDPARDTVKEFYRLNHTYQSYDFVRAKEEEFLSLKRKKMSIKEYTMK